eukprot:2645429-Pleurochrysis_carterae.AAC.1
MKLRCSAEPEAFTLVRFITSLRLEAAQFIVSYRRYKTTTNIDIPDHNSSYDSSTHALRG